MQVSLYRWPYHLHCRHRVKTRLPPLTSVPISHFKMTAYLIIQRITSPALSIS